MNWKKKFVVVSVKLTCGNLAYFLLMCQLYCCVKNAFHRISLECLLRYKNKVDKS